MFAALGAITRRIAVVRAQVTTDKARAVLGALVNAGADVRTIRVYPIQHDKVIIADRQTVEAGSFSYRGAAAHKNSENVLVNWGNAKLAEVYLKHFDRNYAQATAYVQAYRRQLSVVWPVLACEGRSGRRTGAPPQPQRTPSFRHSAVLSAVSAAIERRRSRRPSTPLRLVPVLALPGEQFGELFNWQGD